jgi:oxygen-independent coproporphyrinogen-3 oxidase
MSITLPRKPAEYGSMTLHSTVAAPAITEELLRRLDKPGPRYTSYPTADRFVDAFGPPQYAQALCERAEGGGAIGGSQPLSLYVHIPFCESVCYYCACNKVVTRNHGRAAEYLDALEREVDLHVAWLGAGQPVSQLHFGGGTPTFLDDAELTRLMGYLRKAFRLLPQAEIAIEVDPRTVSTARLEHLASLGFNRMSFGVQDFDPAVQQAVHRVQSFESVASLMRSARTLGFESTNVDLIYGLPKQSAASLRRTVEQVVELRPERVALYSYAHLPQRFKPQRRIDVADIPPAAERVRMLAEGINGFIAQGYEYIGMDHFALPGDALAKAKRVGRLHRNFQGYSTQPDCDLIGLGVSSIGRVGATYSQNVKTLPEYYDALRQGQLPVARGLTLNRDDVVRRAVIMALMCQGRVAFESIEAAHLVDMRRYFAPELDRLRDHATAGLVRIETDAIELTPLGWFFVRAVAMVFDRHLQTDHAREQFSRVV